MKKAYFVKMVTIVVVIFAFGFGMIGCSSTPTWNELPEIDIDNLPRIEIPKDVSTMEIEEDGQVLEFKIIRTFEDLDEIRCDIEADRRIRKNYILANDIDLKPEYARGNEYKFFRSIEGRFLGIFDGNNNGIYNLQFYNELSVPATLIQYLGDEDGGVGIVRNLITHGDMSGGHWTAAIAYANYGIIEDCINFANITKGLEVGGIAITNLKNGIIRNCKNYGQIGILGDRTLGGNDFSGGIVTMNQGTIDNCVNYGTVLASSSAGGGIAGSTSTKTITNCINYGTIVGINIDEDSGIVSTVRNSKPLEIPKSNKNYGSVIVIEK